MADRDDKGTCSRPRYGSDLVALLLGDSYRPGGLALTRRLASRLQLAADKRMLGLAVGRGTSALALAEEFGVCVDGVDPSPGNVALATGAADALEAGGRVRFVAADAERLPYQDATFDAVVGECAFCTFLDKPAAVRELTRVLRPGGRLGVTDVTADPRRLTGELLTSLRSWVACAADAMPVRGYVGILTEVGLRVTHTEPHDEALFRMIDQLEVRSAVARLTAPAELDAMGVDVDRVGPVFAAARHAIADGVLGYSLLVAEKPP